MILRPITFEWKYCKRKLILEDVSYLTLVTPNNAKNNIPYKLVRRICTILENSDVRKKTFGGKSKTVCSCHVTYAFQSESALYSSLNVKELLARSRCEIWSLSECNWTWTQKHLVCKRTSHHLAKLTGQFDQMVACSFRT